MRRVFWIALVIAATALSAACRSTKTIYAWPQYENSLYAMWIEPEDFDLADQIRVLTEQLRAIEQKEKPLPPGVRAHMGYLHQRAGNTAEARRYLLEEKAAYPESAVFVDGLLGRME